MRQTQSAGCKALSVIPLLLPLVLVLLLPVIPRWLPPTSWTTVTLYDWQRIIEIGVLATSVVVSLHLGRKGLFPAARVMWLGAVIVCIGCASILVNHVSWSDAAHEMALLSLLVIAFYAMRSSLSAMETADSAHLATLCLIGSALLYLAVFFAINADSMYAEEFYGNLIMFPGFINVRFFSDYQALVFPFLIFGVTFYCRSVLSRLTGWAAIFLFLMLFFYSGSRAFVFGQIGAHACLCLMLRKAYWPVLSRHALAWLGGYLAFLCSTYLLPYLLIDNFEAIPQYLNTLARTTTWDRNLIWSQAWQQMLSHFWLGIGPGELARHLNVVAAAPHNSLLMIGAEWGGPALFLILVTLLFYGRRAMRGMVQQVNAGDGGFAVAAWQALLALLFHSLVANVLVIPTSQLCLLLAAVLACGVRVPSENVNAANAGLLQRSAYISFCLLIIGLLAVLLFKDIPRLPERNKLYFDCMRPSSSYSPRFWQQGWLIDRCPTPFIDYQPYDLSKPASHKKP